MSELQMTCAEFDAEVDELAVGAVGEPRRSELLAHASTCASCGLRLRDLTDAVESLLELAPPVEPPPGFESRVLGRIAASGLPPARRRGARAVVLVAAVAAVVGLIGGAVVRGGHDGAVAAVERGTIVAPGGARLGAVELVADPAPHVLLAIDHPRPAPGRRSCELERADGSRVVVGSWAYDDIEHGVWATGITDELLRAVRMRILDDDGRAIATARLHTA